MNAGTWEQEYSRPNGLSVEKAPKSDLYLYLLFFAHSPKHDEYDIDSSFGCDKFLPYFACV